MELGRRMEGHELFGLTTPLLTTADGAKMGKTAAGAVWLNEAQLPAYDFWQYWRNVDDRDVGRFLKLFTDLPLDEIARLEALEGARSTMPRSCWPMRSRGWCAARMRPMRARATAEQTFAGDGKGEDLPTLDIPAEGMRIGATCTALGFTATNGEAKRKMAEGAVKLDDEAITDAGHLVELAAGAARLRLSVGKKRHAILRSASTLSNYPAFPDTDLSATADIKERQDMAGGAQLSVTDMRRSTRHPVDYPVIAEHRQIGDMKLHICNLSAHGFMVDDVGAGARRPGDYSPASGWPDRGLLHLDRGQPRWFSVRTDHPAR